MGDDRKTLDLLDLAAYLDGTLAPEERAAVEARLAADPGSLDILLASREALAESAPPPPDSLVRRAAALVEAPQDGALAGGGLQAWLLGSLGWSGALAAVAVAGFIGFELGRISTGGGAAAGGGILAWSAESDGALEQDLAAALSLADEDFL